MEKIYFGVDLHKTQFTTFYQDPSNPEGMYGQFPTNKDGYDVLKNVVNTLQSSGHKILMAVESTGNTRFFKNKVESWGCNVTVVNTLKMKVINESVKKTDKHDAKTLAEFLSKDMLPEAHLCSQESEELRRLLKSRKTLSKAVVSLKNQIHGLLVSYGLESLKSSLQSKKGRQKVLATITESKMDPVNGLVAQQLIDTINLLSEQINKLEKVLCNLVKEDETVTRLMTIPGCGIITASTIRAFMDDINRYATPKKFAAYTGLVPWVQSSNETQHYGKITKRGPKELRTALVQLVLGMHRSRRTKDYRLMKTYRGMKSVKGSGKSIIAIARRLAVVIWTMLTNKEDFNPFKMIDPELKKKVNQMRNAS